MSKPTQIIIDSDYNVTFNYGHSKPWRSNESRYVYTQGIGWHHYINYQSFRVKESKVPKEILMIKALYD